MNPSHSTELPYQPITLLYQSVASLWLTMSSQEWNTSMTKKTIILQFHLIAGTATITSPIKLPIQ